MRAKEEREKHAHKHEAVSAISTQTHIFICVAEALPCSVTDGWLIESLLIESSKNMLQESWDVEKKC